MKSILVAGVLGCLLLPARSEAQTPICDALQGEQRALAQRLLGSERLYDCCDQTVAACLKEKKVCRLAVRLANNICQRVARGQSAAEISRGLARRAQSMIPLGKPSTIDLAGFPSRGAADAPVIAVEYACARCPFCGVLIPKLEEAVVDGSLKGKARLFFKPFPIRGHAHSREANLGLVAAMHTEKFWPFMKLTYARARDFSMENQIAWAKEVSIDPGAFKAHLADEKTAATLVQSAREGLRNGVDGTPTLFIDGHKYLGDNQAAEIIDVLEEAYERKQKLIYLP